MKKIQFSLLIIMFTLIYSSYVIADNILMSNHGSNVLQLSDNTLLSNGNITVEIWDSQANGTSLYSENYINAINNGGWNVILGYNDSNPLTIEYGKRYYLNYLINNENVTFQNMIGEIDERQAFYSSVGKINRTSLQSDIATWTNINNDATFTSGNVGIGTVNPSFNLDINNTNAIARIKSTDEDSYAILKIENDEQEWRLQTNIDDSFYLVDQTEGNTPFIVYSNATHNSLSLNKGGVTINGNNNDVDFRVASDVNPHAFWVRGSDSYVGIGTNSPSVNLDINSSNTIARIKSTDENSYALLKIENDAQEWRLQTNIDDNFYLVDQTEGGKTPFIVNTNATHNSLRLHKGAVVINGNSNDVDFRVASEIDPYAFSVRGSDSYVGIGTTNPQRNVHITDTMRLEPRSAAPSSASLGDLYVDSDSNELCFYDGSSWTGLKSDGVCI
ncbi:hypothetical protein HN827_01945 [archaeon]|jgi:hypothetical protein|nr:hypothetical protein [Candidatus Woesearchaeota archaeon]MBT3464476.1 hypothetical protein [archaeon]MBT4647974.1 hypothetical protein [archaeon]MBT6822639.1 hypothetical protein [archaeon]MBT7391564.1 hypothetical protein [archaeon]